MQNSIGVVKRIRPPHRVAIQLKILIPVGTPTSIVESVKNAFDTEVMPTVNMWCAHTLILTNMMHTEAATIAAAPDTERLRALVWFLLAAAWFLFSDLVASRAAAGLTSGDFEEPLYRILLLFLLIDQPG